MTTATATANFQIDLAGSGKAAPEWVELFPAGPELNARDGRRWRANPKAVLSAFIANRAPLPIDYEHGQDHLAPKGQAAPAAGWIVELADRAGAVWGKVEWTETAAKMIAEREYRFLSPAFTHDRAGLITRLLGAGLVNRPALELTALSREAPNTTPENTNMLKAIAKALGLADDADEAAITAAIAARNNERTAICTALKLDGTPDQGAIVGAITKLGEDTATALAAVQAAPAAVAELAALKTTLSETSTALAALKTKDFTRDVDEALDAAAGQGKVTPASREQYRAMCNDQAGLDRFKALVATLPVICEPTHLDVRNTTASEQHQVDADPVALAARARVYQNEQAAAGRTISISEAVNHVKGQKE